MTKALPEEAAAPALILMCGLPASGKTTTARRLHAALGGVLIRSCDVYQEFGIVLKEWVSRTRGFTANVAGYDRLRDEAYRHMAARVSAALAAKAAVVVVDAVHGEQDKRQRLYEICQAAPATPILVLCRCDDPNEVRRRFHARRGRETEPEHEASDVSVFSDIRRRWQSPFMDELPDGARPAIVSYDTVSNRVLALDGPASPLTARVCAALIAFPAEADDGGLTVPPSLLLRADRVIQ